MSSVDKSVLFKEFHRLFSEKLKQGLFRRLPACIHDEWMREERVQEAICMAFEEFMRTFESKRMSDAMLFRFAKLRATDFSRSFVRGDYVRSNEDFYSFGKHSLRMETVEVFSFGGQSEDDLLFFIDLKHFLQTLVQEDQELLLLRAKGETLKQISGKLKRSKSSLSRRLVKLEKLYREFCSSGS